MAWFQDCAYYDTNDVVQQTNRGSVALDASNQANPVVTAYLNDPSLAEPWESLKAHEKRKLLAAVQANNGSETEPGFSIYDISTDCKHPKLLASLNLETPGLPGTRRGHAGDFCYDGLTYYGTGAPFSGGVRGIYPIDIADPAHPKLLAKWDSLISVFLHTTSLQMRMALGSI